MFDNLFGWRKASKCKKLIKRLQCRLKLVKSKRFCIVKQMREDVARLIKHGFHHTAFQRVEQLIKDENMIEVYDLLYQFCEFIIINLPYIRKHRDCPNDIKEAASTLIFSSARFGELPELLSIRKLFGQRYSEKLVTTALDLLPGNLVNDQVKEYVYMEKVSDDVKHRVLDAIRRTCIQSGPLLLEYYKPEMQEDRMIMDLLSENQRIQPWTDEVESSSDSSGKLPQEVIYLDDIEELVTPVIKNGSLQDQRLFMFRSFGKKIDSGVDEEKIVSTRKTRKNMRRRSRSLENRNVMDIECAIYYGEPYEKEHSYTRAMSVPCERGDESSSCPDNMNRSSSFPCRHIHPKLPDYDELAAKFMELKRANLMKQLSSNPQV